MVCWGGQPNDRICNGCHCGWHCSICSMQLCMRPTIVTTELVTSKFKRHSTAISNHLCISRRVAAVAVCPAHATLRSTQWCAADHSHDRLEHWLHHQHQHLLSTPSAVDAACIAQVCRMQGTGSIVLVHDARPHVGLQWQHADHNISGGHVSCLGLRSRIIPTLSGNTAITHSHGATALSRCTRLNDNIIRMVLLLDKFSRAKGLDYWRANART
jgi:hypothetical protein